MRAGRGWLLVIGCWLACSRTPPAPRVSELGASTAGSSTAALPPPAHATASLPTPNRRLTRGERTMLKQLFRDAISYDDVRVIHAAHPLQPTDAYMTLHGHLYAPGTLFRADFSSTALPADERAIFIHEMAHVWQHANGMNLVAHAVMEMTKHGGAYEKAYPYRLDPRRDLLDYGMEQQASILEDYYLVTVERRAPLRLVNRGLSHRQRDALYAKVLARFQLDAHYARELSE